MQDILKVESSIAKKTVHQNLSEVDFQLMVSTQSLVGGSIIDPCFIEVVLEKWNSHPKLFQEGRDWVHKLWAQVDQSRRGYPLGLVPYASCSLEEELVEMLSSLGISSPLNSHEPTICISHDIDHLRPTKLVWAKQLISQRRFLFRFDSTDYLGAIEELLNFDAHVAGLSTMTCFISNPIRSGGWSSRLMQSVIDPTYNIEDARMIPLLRLLTRSGSAIGVHGSFFSLAHDTFSWEKAGLEAQLKSRISLCRQHWLNLPRGRKDLSRIKAAGIQVDSTLGWNGKAGCRGGFYRPYPVVVGPSEFIWEMPLLLMDRTLHDGMRFSVDQVVDESCRILEEVFKKRGTVSINWHEAALHSDFGWGESYRQVLKWAKERGFAFKSIEAVQKDRGLH
jgi:hypothetical protein